MTWQDDMFVERLVRLDQKKSRMKGLRERRQARNDGQKTRRTLDLGHTLSVLGAGVIGLLCVPLSRLAMYQSRGLGNLESNPELVMVIDGLFAFCIAYFLVRIILSASSLAHMIAQVAGVWIALATMHNFVHAQPEAWAQAFSPEWVERTLATTQPNTLFLFGTGFP